MAKRIIDADALDILIKYIENGEIFPSYDDLIEKINELATPAPVAQEGDEWCWDTIKLNDFNPTTEFWFLLQYKKSKKYRQTICSVEYMQHLCIARGSYNLIAWRPLPPIPTR